MDGFNPMNGGTTSPGLEDLFSFSELLNFDGYAELCGSPLPMDRTPVSFGLSATQPPQGNWNPFLSWNGATEVIDGQRVVDGSTNANGGYADCSENLVQQKDDAPNKATNAVPKSLPLSLSLADKMFTALSFFKESSGSGFLAQVWMPVKYGEEYVLSTSDQPYLLDRILAGYREISRSFVFSASEAPGSFPGLPGRVFLSKLPEWTSNVIYYSKDEYLRGSYALNHKVRASLGIPVLDPSNQSCCAVLELITTKEKPNFEIEMEIVTRALQAVNLNTVNGRTQEQNLTTCQRAALSEIMDVLTAVCHAHMLPLALTWVPSVYDGASDEVLKSNVGLGCSSSSKSYSLNVLESACYINDLHMKGFLRACLEHQLKKGQGIAGKALQSNHPFFCPDVKGYCISEYPLVHHARKFGLNSAVAIRLRSIHTGDFDYILEFFLPVNCNKGAEQQHLLNKLSSTMQRVCKSLRTVSDTKVLRSGTRDINGYENSGGLSISDMPVKSPTKVNDLSDVSKEILQNKDQGCKEGDAMHYEQVLNSRRHLEKKRNTTEKNISLSTLQQYFSGSLKDAAKSLGVCPTTLKRICRQHGISRWPSRKIHKVNSSLKKIQTVIDSVQGVEGALKYDLVSGSLVAAVPSSGKLVTGAPDVGTVDMTQPSPIFHVEGLHSNGKSEADDCSTSHPGTRSLSEFRHSIAIKDEREQPETNNQPASVQAAFNLENLDQHMASRTPNALPAAYETASGNNRIVHHHHNSSSSGMTDSSNGSESSIRSDKKSLEVKEYAGEHGPSITVKATYKEDTVRFKFAPSTGCQHLFEEISRRFRLVVGTFQLKYMDDEDEWVMLASEADLQECVEILESIGSQGVKILVRDLPHTLGSSTSSNYLMMES